MENGHPYNNQQLWIIVGVVVILLFLLRIHPLRFLILIILALGGLLYGLYGLWRYWTQKRADMAFRRTDEGMVVERISYCEKQIQKYQAELEEINHTVRELQQQMDRPEISERNRKESQRLIAAFDSEADLRRLKINFFERCIGKLRRLLHNHQLSRSIVEKRERLEKLKENHYEDLAALEELKTELEMGAAYLETIETLSLRMLESTDSIGAQRLRRELEEMTRDLNTL